MASEAEEVSRGMVSTVGEMNGPPSAALARMVSTVGEMKGPPGAALAKANSACSRKLISAAAYSAQLQTRKASLFRFRGPPAVAPKSKSSTTGEGQPSDTEPVEGSSSQSDDIVTRAIERVVSLIQGGLEADVHMPAELELRGLDRLVIPPDSAWKNHFDVFIVICVLYTSVTMPIKVVFSVDFLDAVDMVLDIFFWLDICLQFCHSYIGHNGFPVRDFRLVAWRYVHSWFGLDLVAALPIESFAPHLRALQLVKLARLMRLKRLMAKLNGYSGGNVIRVATIMGMWVMVSHWIGCGFIFIGWQSCPEDGMHPDDVVWEPLHNPENRTWITVYWPQLLEVCGTGTLDEQALPIVSISTLYVRAMYFALSAMSSLGLGDAPRAHTNVEYIFAMCAQVVGACMAAAIFSNVAQLINKGDAVAQRFQEQTSQVNEFIRFHRLPVELSTKLVRFKDLQFAVTRGTDMKRVASLFPRALQEDIFFNLHEKLIRQVPFFTGCSDVFIKALVPKLKPIVVMADDFVFMADHVSHTMYFIEHGFIQICDDARRHVFATLTAGAYFGEIAMFTTERIHTAAAVAVNNCVLYALSSVDFHSLDADQSAEQESVLELAEKAIHDRIKALDKQREAASGQKKELKRLFKNAMQVEPALKNSRRASHADGINRFVEVCRNAMKRTSVDRTHTTLCRQPNESNRGGVRMSAVSAPPAGSGPPPAGSGPPPGGGGQAPPQAGQPQAGQPQAGQRSRDDDGTCRSSRRPNKEASGSTAARRSVSAAHGAPAADALVRASVRRRSMATLAAGASGSSGVQAGASESFGQLEAILAAQQTRSEALITARLDNLEAQLGGKLAEVVDFIDDLSRQLDLRRPTLTMSLPPTDDDDVYSLVDTGAPHDGDMLKRLSTGSAGSSGQSGASGGGAGGGGGASTAIL